jgi:hypothetical protein
MTMNTNAGGNETQNADDNEKQNASGNACRSRE